MTQVGALSKKRALPTRRSTIKRYCNLSLGILNHKEEMYVDVFSSIEAN